jgi:glycerol-3-phosphate O-acyltransferase / dihydroxyacetone phosphate acyltransferase
MEGCEVRSLLVGFVRLLLRIFFSRVEQEGIERVPRTEPCMFVLNHPNGLLDPMVLTGLAPRPLAFMAKSTLFAVPLLGALMRVLDCLPVYRHQDAGSDTTQNQKTFASARAWLARGGSIALFPEGTTHSKPHLLPIKTGAARIALGTVAQEASAALWIVPAGLYYTKKGYFRSKVLLVYGRPLRVDQSDLAEGPEAQAAADPHAGGSLPGVTSAAATSEAAPGGEPTRAAVGRLSLRIQQALEALALQASEQRILDQVAIAQQLFASGVGTATLYDELTARQRFVEGYQRLAAHDAARLAEFERRLLGFDHDLAAAGLSYQDIVVRHAPGQSLVKTAALAVAELLVLGVPALVGILVHAPIYEGVAWLAHRLAREDDTVLSTYKLFGSLLLYPVLWAGLAWYVHLGRGWLLGLLTFPGAWLCALAALRLLERAEQGSRGSRALLCFLTRRGEFARLVEEQSQLRDEFRRLGEAMGLLEVAAASDLTPESAAS